MTLTAVPPQIGPKTKDGAKPSVLVLNKLVGLVVARHHSHRRHYHVRTTDGVMVTVQDPALPGRAGSLSIGQQVSLRIPPHAVVISPAKPLEATEANVWAARVVLSAGHEAGSLLIVKVLGKPWTLTSTQPGGPLAHPLQTWDRVTLRIRPEACLIHHRYPHDSRLRPRLLTGSSSSPGDPVPTQPDNRPPYPARKGREPLSCVPCPTALDASGARASREADYHHSRRERSRL